MANYDFIQNTACEYFPCHKGVCKENFNCLFCYCPLYALADKCGGNFTYTDNGIKDCSCCTIPHDCNQYYMILERMSEVIEIARKHAE